MSDETTQPLLRLRGIRKSFGGVHALSGVDLVLRPGEVHALIGENGAGKSTLMKVLSGSLRADAGSIWYNGRERRITSPMQGRNLGIAMIYQELNLAPHLTAAENLELGRERTRLTLLRPQRARMREVLTLLEHPGLPLDIPVRRLSVGQQQVIEIARALMSDARLIIMDEPTSSLTAADAEVLFRVVRKLRDSGIAVIYISHFLEEVIRVADNYTVLRDGKTVASGAIADASLEQIIKAMVGRDLDEMFPRSEHEIGEVILRVRGLRSKPVPQDVDLTLRRGEILGIAGLVGAGRSEAVRSLFGLQKADAGVVQVGRRKEQPARRMQPGRSLRMGLDLLSEDRKAEGLATSLSITHNMTLASLRRYASLRGWGPLRLGRERTAVQHWADELNLRHGGLLQPVESLSGGNQQKVALARMLENGNDVLLLDEPTRGVDVGSKVEIYRLINALAAAGKGIVFISSYLPELLGVCDTIGVMHRGRLSAVRPVSEWTEEAIMAVATGSESAAAAAGVEGEKA